MRRYRDLDTVEQFVGTDMREVVWTYIKKTFTTRGVKSLWMYLPDLFLTAATTEKFSNPVLIHPTHQLATATIS
jgi:hypothetical protein